MPNLLNRGAAFLGSKLKTAGGRSVTYRRKTKSVSITITPLELQETTETTENIGTEVDKYDWTITAADLVLGGETTLPQRGDVIEETINGEEYEYQALPSGPDKQCWEWLDKATRTLLRVHTKKIKGR